jgi:hypothetical protein
VKSFYNKLVFNVYGCISVETLVEMEKRTLLKDKEVEDFEIKIKESEKQMHQLEENIGYLNNQIKEFEERLAHAFESAGAMGTMDEVVTEQGASVIMEGCETLVVTSMEWDRVFDAIGSHCLIQPCKLNMLDEMTRNFEGIIFIDRNSIKNTRELLEIEKKINKMNKRKAVILGSSPAELVRNIIIKKSRLEE